MKRLAEWVPWVVVGTALRAWDLPSRGLALGDEAGRVLTARTIVEMGAWLVSRVTGGATDLASHLRAFMGPPGQSLGYPPDPFWGYQALLVLVAGPLGLPAYSTQLLSVVFGSLSLVLVWRLASLGGMRSLAPLTVAILAFAPYHVLYSRIGVPQVVASAFVLLSVTLYIQSRTVPDTGRRLRLAGLAIGVALLIHVTALMNLTALVVAELAGVRWRELAERKQLWRRARLFVPAAAAPIVATELVGWLGLVARRVLLPQVDWHYTYVSSFAEVLFRDVAGRGRPVLSFGIDVMTALQGVPFVVALVIGAIMSARALGSVFHRTVLLQVVIPFAALSVNGLQVPRAFTGLIPFAAVLAAIGIGAVTELVAHRTTVAPAWLRPALAGVLAAGVVAGGTAGLVSTLTLRSGYRTTAEYLRAQGSAQHMSTQRAGTGVYLGIPSSISPPPEREHALQALSELAARHHVRYLVVDYAKEAQYPSVGELKATCRPVWSTPNPAGDSWPLVADEYAVKDWIRQAWASPRRAYIDVYDMASCLDKRP